MGASRSNRIADPGAAESVPAVARQPCGASGCGPEITTSPLPDHLSEIAGAPVYIVHLSSEDALNEVREARDRGWKLAILSNTDRDYIEASLTHIGVPFDEVIGGIAANDIVDPGTGEVLVEVNGVVTAEAFDRMRE
mgnify:CR=1 FL=1